MREIDLEFNFTDMPEVTMTGIGQCVKDNKPFGLVSRRGRNVVVFSIQHLKSWWVLTDGTVQAAYSYNNEQDFMNGVSMQLLTHRNFVAPEMILQAPQTHKLLEQL